MTASKSGEMPNVEDHAVRKSPKLINNDDMVKMMKLKMMSLMMNPVPTCLMAGMNLHMIEFTR